jgi:hypothetical protein
MTDKHTPTIKKGAERRGSALVWFLCSCGDSGSAQKTQAAALEDFQAHVDKSEAAERLERIRAAAPELLEALEEWQSAFGTLSIDDLSDRVTNGHILEMEGVARRSLQLLATVSDKPKYRAAAKGDA